MSRRVRVGYEAVLCQLDGYLVLIEARPAKSADSYFAKCPSCGNREFNGEWHGWTLCAGDECGFAILTSDLERLKGLPPEGLSGDALPNIVPGVPA